MPRAASGRAGRRSGWRSSTAGSRTGTATVPIVASTDGWATWTQRGTWNQASFGTSSWMVGDRTDEGRFYVACGQGLVRITNAFSGTLGFTKLSGQGGLPAGGVAGKPYVSADGQTIIVGTGDGIYRSDGRRVELEPGGQRERLRQAAGEPLRPEPHDPDLRPAEQAAAAEILHGRRRELHRDRRRRRRAAPRPPLHAADDVQLRACGLPFHPRPRLALRPADAACRRPRTTTAPRTTARSWSLSTEGFNGSNFGNRGVSPFMFSPTDRNRFALSFLDSAIWLTNDGGQSFTQSTYTNEQTGQDEADHLRGLAASGRGAPDDVRRGGDRQLLRPGALARRRGDLGPAARPRHQVRRQPDRLRSRRSGPCLLGPAPQHQPRRRRLVADVGARRRLRGLGLHARRRRGWRTGRRSSRSTSAPASRWSAARSTAG